MRTDGQTIRGNELAIPHVDLESVKAWAKATFTKERMTEVGLAAATLVVNRDLLDVGVLGQASGPTLTSPGEGGMKMLAIINILREHPGADFWGIWDELRERAKRSITNEAVARNGLAFAGAVSMCYAALRIVEGLQSYVAYAY